MTFLYSFSVGKLLPSLCDILKILGGSSSTPRSGQKRLCKYERKGERVTGRQRKRDNEREREREIF